jgi:hypothetical protein
MPLKTHPRNIDKTYGPTLRSRYYLPKSDHRTHSKASVKTKWNIAESEEYDVFYQCDDVQFYCSKNRCFFAIIDNGHTVLGKDGERLAKFPHTVNVADPWHGYPVTSTYSWDKPCDCMLDLWESLKIINSVTKRRIEKGLL